MIPFFSSSNSPFFRRGTFSSKVPLMEHLGHLTQPNSVPLEIPIIWECLCVLFIEHLHDLSESWSLTTLPWPSLYHLWSENKTGCLWRLKGECVWCTYACYSWPRFNPLPRRSCIWNVPLAHTCSPWASFSMVLSLNFDFYKIKINVYLVQVLWKLTEIIFLM